MGPINCAPNPQVVGLNSEKSILTQKRRIHRNKHVIYHNIVQELTFKLSVI